MRFIFSGVVKLLAFLAVVGGLGAWYVYEQGDSLLRDEVLRHLHQQSPGARFRLAKAKFDLSGQLRLFQLQVFLPGEKAPAAILPEIELVVDRDLLTQQQKVVIKSVRCLQPKAWLTQDQAGHWNWERFPFTPQKTPQRPAVVIDGGQLDVVARSLKSTEAQFVTQSLSVSDLQLLLKPQDDGLYRATVKADCQQLGQLQSEININLVQKSWQAKGELGSVRIGPDLFSLSSHFVPGIESQTQTGLYWLAKQFAPPASQSAGPIANRDTPAMPISLAPQQTNEQFAEASVAAIQFPNLGVDALAHLKFQLTQPIDGQPDGQLDLELERGEITNPLLPLPLSGLQAAVHLDQAGIVLSNLSAYSGGMLVHGEGHYGLDGSGKLHLDYQNIELTERLRQKLPTGLRKVTNELALTGQFSGVMDVDRTPGQPPQLSVTVNGQNCRFAHEKFPYPITNGVGKLIIQQQRLDLFVRGLAQDTPITIRGVAFNPGPGLDAAFDIRANGVPVDRVLKESCPPGLKKTLNNLNLTGMTDLIVRLVRPGGVGQKFETRVAARLYRGTLKCESFRYPLQDVSAEIIDDGKRVELKNITARHDSARLTGSGSFEKFPAPGLLQLKVVSEKTQFDQQLYEAVPQALKEAWDDISPRGEFDIDTRIRWIPGEPPVVIVPQLQLKSADILMKSFPFALSECQSNMTWRDGELTIHDFSGKHDETTVHAHGVAQTQPSAWKMVLGNLQVDDLQTSATFRKALPKSLGQIVGALNPTRPFSLSGTLELAGNRSQVSETKWNLQFVLPDNDVTVGQRLERVRGRIDLVGETTEAGPSFDGTLDLDSLRVFGYQLSQVKGPLSLKDGVLTVGSAEIMVPPPAAKARFVPLAERVSAKVIDGTLTFDSQVQLDSETPTYQLKTTLARGNLEKYAQLYTRGQPNLKGIMNGWMELQGRGADAQTVMGQGQLQISPAALYELPVVVQIFRSLQLAGDKTAFRYADLVFNVRDEKFNFQSIDLVGNAINLRGRGYVRFDGGMMLDFYSMLSRNQVRIPVVHEIIGMMSRGWVGVEVRGNVGAPVARVVPVPELDDAMRQFLRPIEPRNVGNAPPTFAPARIGSDAGSKTEVE